LLATNGWCACFPPRADPWPWCSSAPKVTEYDYEHSEKTLARGEEMGRFNMGSTVILLTTEKVQWGSQLQPGQTLRMGEMIGAWRP